MGVKHAEDATRRDPDLGPRARRAATASGISPSELIQRARHDDLCESLMEKDSMYWPGRSYSRLRAIRGIGEGLASGIINTLRGEGYILKIEDQNTRSAWSLLVEVLGGPEFLVRRYDEFERVTPEGEKVVRSLIREALSDEELQSQIAQIVEYRHGFDGGELHSLQECARFLNLDVDQTRSLYYMAINKLRGDEREFKLKMAACCYSRKALAARMSAQKAVIDEALRKLQAIVGSCPYPGLVNELFSTNTGDDAATSWKDLYTIIGGGAELSAKLKYVEEALGHGGDGNPPRQTRIESGVYPAAHGKMPLVTDPCGQGEATALGPEEDSSAEPRLGQVFEGELGSNPTVGDWIDQIPSLYN